MATLLDLIIMLVVGGIILGFIAGSAMFVIWLERKVSAHIQSRLGPMRVGWHGWLQSVADAIKLLLKEDIRPKGVDTWVWWAAPFFATVPSVMAFICIPFGKPFEIRGLQIPVIAPDGLRIPMIVSDLNVGILYILSVTSVCVLGIFMAGWGSNNKYSLLGGFRSGAQIVSYEVPLVLSVITVVMYVGSLSMQTIVEAQGDWYGLKWFVLRPNLALAFIVYLIAATAETNRTPFDIPEAESELVAGFHTEYSGMKFAMFFVAEYTNVFIVSAVAATLFLGGWQGPPIFQFILGYDLPFMPVFWFLLKVYFVIFLLMWFRWTFPRVRVDQLTGFAWKVLTPVSFANLAFTGWWLLR